jgi:ABC-type arginine/histidine transport system permease subunit
VSIGSLPELEVDTDIRAEAPVDDGKLKVVDEFCLEDDPNVVDVVVVEGWLGSLGVVVIELVFPIKYVLVFNTELCEVVSIVGVLVFVWVVPGEVLFVNVVLTLEALDWVRNVVLLDELLPNPPVVVLVVLCTTAYSVEVFVGAVTVVDKASVGRDVLSDTTVVVLGDFLVEETWVG